MMPFKRDFGEGKGLGIYLRIFYMYKEGAIMWPLSY